MKGRRAYAGRQKILIVVQILVEIDCELFVQHYVFLYGYIKICFLSRLCLYVCVYLIVSGMHTSSILLSISFRFMND